MDIVIRFLLNSYLYSLWLVHLSNFNREASLHSKWQLIQKLMFVQHVMDQRLWRRWKDFNIWRLWTSAANNFCWAWVWHMCIHSSCDYCVRPVPEQKPRAGEVSPLADKLLVFGACCRRVNFLHRCVLREATPAPVYGPTPMQVQAALSGLSGLNRSQEVGRKGLWGG